MTKKVYLENPYIRQIDGRIVQKKYIDDRYHIKINRTIFYPNLSDGQPGDKSTINGIDVLDVYEDGDDIIHVVDENISSKNVKLSIDWDNRLDYMQQHSGQHLLSAGFYKLFNGETIGFYIGEEHSHVDVNIPYMGEEYMDKIELFANKVIYSNFTIKSYTMNREDMDRLPVRNEMKSESNIRIVEIDGIDFSPCNGTHLRRTGEIGIIKIKDIQAHKDYIRVQFLCGYRALKDYGGIMKENKRLKDDR